MLFDVMILLEKYRNNINNQYIITIIYDNKDGIKILLRIIERNYRIVLSYYMQK